MHYEASYEKFLTWKNAQGINLSNEKVLMAYFNELSKNYKLLSLWGFYSKLKNTLNVKKQIDISKYHFLNAFLKSKLSGFISKKSKGLTFEEVHKF